MLRNYDGVLKIDGEVGVKKQYDPQERFQSDWYRHYRTMFA